MAAGPVPGTVWERLEDDEDGAIYYYNTVTNDVTWDKPEEVAAADAAEAAEGVEAPAVEAEPTPDEDTAEEEDPAAGAADTAARVRAMKATKVIVDIAEEDPAAGAAGTAAQVRAMKATKAIVDTAEEDPAASAADMAARVRAMKATKAAVTTAEEDPAASAADMVARVRAMKATKAAVTTAEATGSRETEATKPAAAELAADDAADAEATAPPERGVRIQAARSEEVSVSPQRSISDSGLLTQLGRGHVYPLYDAQPPNLYAPASGGTPVAAAAAAAAAAAITAEARAETKRHEERVAWSQESLLGMPPAGQSPLPPASLMGTFHAPSGMASPWADTALFQTDQVQEANHHLTGVSAGDCGISPRVSRNVSRVESPDALQRLTRLQTENTVLRDRLLIAEGALDSLRIHGEQERYAREAMHATLVASESSRALLREELVQTRGVQRELEADLAELRRQVSELSLFRDFDRAR